MGHVAQWKGEGDGIQVSIDPGDSDKLPHVPVGAGEAGPVGAAMWTSECGFIVPYVLIICGFGNV